MPSEMLPWLAAIGLVALLVVYLELLTRVIEHRVMDDEEDGGPRGKGVWLTLFIIVSIVIVCLLVFALLPRESKELAVLLQQSLYYAVMGVAVTSAICLIIDGVLYRRSGQSRETDRRDEGKDAIGEMPTLNQNRGSDNVIKLKRLARRCELLYKELSERSDDGTTDATDRMRDIALSEVESLLQATARHHRNHGSHTRGPTVVTYFDGQTGATANGATPATEASTSPRRVRRSDRLAVPFGTNSTSYAYR